MVTDGAPRLWGAMAWPELRAALQGGREVGLVPLGAIEQHGPHLPLATDVIVATALCERASAVSDGLVMPTLNLGCSFGHGAEFPGTISLSPDMLTMTIRQYVEWAATAGPDEVPRRRRAYGQPSGAAERDRLPAPAAAGPPGRGVSLVGRLRQRSPPPRCTTRPTFTPTGRRPP